MSLESDGLAAKHPGMLLVSDLRRVRAGETIFESLSFAYGTRPMMIVSSISQLQSNSAYAANL